MIHLILWLAVVLITIAITGVGMFYFLLGTLAAWLIHAYVERKRTPPEVEACPEPDLLLTDSQVLDSLPEHVRAQLR